MSDEPTPLADAVQNIAGQVSFIYNAPLMAAAEMLRTQGDRIAELEAEVVTLRADLNVYGPETGDRMVDRIAELEAKVRRYEAMEPCDGNCDLAWRHR